MGCELTIRKGSNRWVLARTDRDGATRADVVDTTGAFLSKVLGQASPLALRSVFEVMQFQDEPRWVIGAARPVVLEAAQQVSTPGEAMSLSRPQGQLLGTATQCPVVRTVDAATPWLVSVEFDWRAPTVVVPWPRRKTVFGFPVEDDTQLDWLLLGAAYGGAAKHSDTSVLKEVSDATARTIREAAAAAGRVVTPFVVGTGVALLALVWAARRKKT